MRSPIRVWVLSLSLAALASGANLVCNEKEGNDEKLSCRFEVGYDEIADAFNLNCEPSKDGLKCSFEARKNSKTTVVLPSPDSARIKACSDDDLLCLNARFLSQLIPSDKPVPKTEQPPEPAKTEPILIQQPPDGIRIENYVYKEPFTQYADPIQRTLKNRASLFKAEPKDISSEYALANAHLDIGIAHFTSVTEEDYSPGSHSTESAPESFDLKLAVGAFRVAESMYKTILGKYDREKDTIYKSLAALYLQWGEAYQNSHYFDDDITEDDGTEFNKLALKQYQKAEQYYRLALESAKEKEGQPSNFVAMDIQLNLAHVCHRIGRCMINSIEGNAVMAEDLDLDQTELSDAIPALQTLMNTIPKAENMFAEAIRLYRIAIEAEKDFGVKSRLKMNLATSLQDGGTAASYGSNLPRAIEYQEESIAINKEVLPHVGAYDRLFLVQYIADSMYGLANHCMQLGKYDDTKKTYNAAMDWYEKNNLEPARTPAVAGFEVTDEALEAYEKQLTDYHELVREVTMPDGYVDDGQPMYGPNDAYEADLHAALGSLHLSREEILMAIEHYNQAIRLYQNAQTEENLDRYIADVKVSLAAALFKDGEFASSAEAHSEAMDIYKHEVGEGKNPLMAGLAEKLSGNIDINDIVAGSDLGELLDVSDIQELFSGMGVDATGLTEQLERLLKRGATAEGGANAKGAGASAEPDKDKGPTETTNNNKGPTQTTNSHNKQEKNPEKTEKKVHEQLINAEIIEKVRLSILNATATKDEL